MQIFTVVFFFFFLSSQNQCASVLASPPLLISVALLLSASVPPTLNCRQQKHFFTVHVAGKTEWSRDSSSVYFAKPCAVLQDFAQ